MVGNFDTGRQKLRTALALRESFTVLSVVLNRATKSFAVLTLRETARFSPHPRTGLLQYAYPQPRQIASKKLKNKGGIDGDDGEVAGELFLDSAADDIAGVLPQPVSITTSKMRFVWLGPMTMRKS